MINSRKYLKTHGYPVMKKVLAGMLAICLLAIAGCTTSVHSRYSYDASTDFSSIDSYAWKAFRPDHFSSPESAERFKATMDRMLQEKGFKLDADSADFLIETKHVETHKETFSSMHGPVDFPDSMIRINFLNPKTNANIFEAAVEAFTDTENETSQEKKNSVIDRSVETLMKDFPPGE